MDDERYSVHVGQRVKFRDRDGVVRNGTVLRINHSYRPLGAVIVKDDDGREHEVPIGIGPSD